MTASLLDLVKTRTVLFDGAMGTELMARGLGPGVPPELWNAERPDAVREVHAAYYEAGADVVSTNSFGGTPLKLAAHGLEGRAFELNRAAARLAREAAPAGRYVAGSMGPTGKFLKPQGPATEADLVAPPMPSRPEVSPTAASTSSSSRRNTTCAKPSRPSAARAAFRRRSRSSSP